MAERRSKFSAVGARAPKPDAPAKAAGRAVYGHDLVRPNTLEGKILRSPHAHARIIEIDTSRAERLPGVFAVLTGKDVPDKPFGYGEDNYVLKRDVVRRVGDEVAAVAAVDADTAREALDLIKVRYKPLPAVFDPQAAVQQGAPLVHSHRDSNLFRQASYVHGDPETALGEADVVVEDEFELPYAANMPMEPCFCLAEFEPSGELTVYSTTQIPYLLQRDLALALGIPASEIRILQTAIGGSFGRGLDMYPHEPISVALARASGRPVRIAFDRREEFAAAPLRQPLRVRMRSGAKKDGRLWVRQAQATLDIGAYASWGTVTTLVMSQTVGSLYRVPHAQFDYRMVYTNNPITGAMRGFGNPQSTFFVESQMDQLAEALDMDPLEFRLRNANRPNEETPQGLRITSCGLRECLENLETARLPEAQRSREGDRYRRGVGFASVMNVGGGARIYRSDACGALVKIDDFGRVSVVTGATEIGQGMDVALTQIVAETLGVPLQAVRVVSGDTAVAPWDVGVHASRTTFIAGKAAMLAAEEARQQIVATACEMLDVHPDDVVLRDGKVFSKGAADEAVSLGKVVRARHFRPGGQAVLGRGWYDPPNEMVGDDLHGNLSASYGFGAHAAVVEVDTLTGRIKVERIVAAHDVGRAINPMMVEAQIEGGIHMGLGYALSEQLLVELGRVVNDSFREYGILTALDMPSIETTIVETLDPEGPFGAKGVGEMGVVPVAPAVANAIYDAVGVRITTLPIDPETVLFGILEQRDR